MDSSVITYPQTPIYEGVRNMTKYHNTPNGPRTCTANIRDCIYAESGGDHYDNFADAQKAYETDMEEKYGRQPTLSKSDKLSQKAHESFYTAQEQLREATQRNKRKFNKKLQATVKLVKANPKVQELNNTFTHLVNEARVAREMKKEQISNFKSRAVSGYRVNKQRAKTLVQTSQNKYRAVKSSSSAMKQALLARKDASVNRAREAVQEGKYRLKAATDIQKEAVKALRQDSPQLREQKRAIELQELSEAANHNIDEKIIKEYYEGMERAKLARHRAKIEAKKFATPGEGRRRATV